MTGLDFSADSAEPADDVLRRLTEIRGDQADIYKLFDGLRQRVQATEAMTIALAWAHPNWGMLLERLRFFMDLAVDPHSDTRVVRQAASERDRVLRRWQNVLLASPTPSDAPNNTYH